MAEDKRSVHTVSVRFRSWVPEEEAAWQELSKSLNKRQVGAHVLEIVLGALGGYHEELRSVQGIIPNDSLEVMALGKAVIEAGGLDAIINPKRPDEPPRPAAPRPPIPARSTLPPFDAEAQERLRQQREQAKLKHPTPGKK